MKMRKTKKERRNKNKINRRGTARTKRGGGQEENVESKEYVNK